jgi:hypothetical protein
LARMDRRAVDHYGQTTGGYTLLWRKFRSGYFGGAGEVLRSALGQGHLSIVISHLSHIRNSMAVMLWWLTLAGSAFVSLSILLSLLVLPLCYLSVRRRSLRLGLYCLAAWNITALGFIPGVLRCRVAPSTPLSSRDLTDGAISPISAGPEAGYHFSSGAVSAYANPLPPRPTYTRP